MLRNIPILLNLPFPEEGNTKKHLRNTFLISVFVGLFLYFFRPFGLDAIEDDFEIVCLVFGLITFFASFIMEVLWTNILKLEKDLPTWTFGKWLVATLLLVLVTALGNYLYVLYIFDQAPSVAGLGLMLVYTASIAIFPVTAIGYSRVMKQTQTNELVANSLNERRAKTELSSSPAASNKKIHSVSASSILYIEAMQNYVSVWYLHTDGLQSEIIRTTIKDTVSEISDTSLLRCHRSYIVNKEKIERIEGNAQGLKLSLTDLADKTIPVSRSYIKLFKA